MLRAQNLRKHFGGINAVDNVNFELKENRITALIGPNGSGKTTLFNLISGILKADSGKINFQNKNLIGMHSHDISNLGFSRLFQQSRLFDNLTVKENLMISLNNEDTQFWKSLSFIKHLQKSDEIKIKEALKSFEIEMYKNKLSKDLSYGQKRLVEIIRAILNPHKILVLDEPVAGVNPKLRKEISRVLLNLKKKGETVFLIEHDINFILNIADEIIVMDEGKIIAQGSPKQIKIDKKVIEAYLGG